MLEISDAHVIRADITADPVWGPAVRHADDLVRAELGEFQAGKVVEWRRPPGDPDHVEVTIRSGPHAGAARLSLDDLSYQSTIESRGRIAWGRLNNAQAQHALSSIRRILTELMTDAEADEAAGVARG